MMATPYKCQMNQLKCIELHNYEYTKTIKLPTLHVGELDGCKFYLNEPVPKNKLLTLELQVACGLAGWWKQEPDWEYV